MAYQNPIVAAVNIRTADIDEFVELIDRGEAAARAHAERAGWRADADSPIRRIVHTKYYDSVDRNIVTIRSGVVFEACLQAAPKPSRAAALAALNAFREWFADELACFANLLRKGAMEHEEWTTEVLTECESQLAPGSKKREYGITLGGPESYLSSYCFKAHGPGLTMISMRFPRAFPCWIGGDVLAGRLSALVATWPELGWARCGPALLLDRNIDHEGLEALRSKSWLVEEDAPTPRQLPRAGWLTYVGPTLAARCTLDVARAAGVFIESVGSAVLLRAGTAPEVGDMPLLRAAARALEPVSRALV